MTTDGRNPGTRNRTYIDRNGVVREGGKRPDHIISKDMQQRVDEARADHLQRISRPRTERSGAALAAQHLLPVAVETPWTGQSVQRVRAVPTRTYLRIRRDGLTTALTACRRDGSSYESAVTLVLSTKRYERIKLEHHIFPVFVARDADGSTLTEITEGQYRRLRHNAEMPSGVRRRPRRAATRTHPPLGAEQLVGESFDSFDALRSALREVNR